MSADRFPSLHTVPALAMDRALKKVGVGAADLAVLEVNEAFAGVAVHTTRMLGCGRSPREPERWRGRRWVIRSARAALGSCSRPRSRCSDVTPSLGGAAICGGGGQGDALVLRRV